MWNLLTLKVCLSEYSEPTTQKTLKKVHLEWASTTDQMTSWGAQTWGLVANFNKNHGLHFIWIVVHLAVKS